MQADDLDNHIINSLLRLAYPYRVGAANYRQLVLAALVGIHYARDRNS